MNALDVLLERITKAGLLVGGFFLIIGMLLLMSNIFGRFLHLVIPGSYEMFELFMVIPVGFALVYAALKKSHVVVHLVVSEDGQDSDGRLWLEPWTKPSLVLLVGRAWALARPEGNPYRVRCPHPAPGAVARVLTTVER